MIDEEVCIQRYSLDGDMMKGVYIGCTPYNDQYLLLRFVSRHEDPTIIKTMEFLEYKGFNAAKVTNIYGFSFFVTIQPVEEHLKNSGKKSIFEHE